MVVLILPISSIVVVVKVVDIVVEVASSSLWNKLERNFKPNKHEFDKFHKGEK